jgi:hypothetical protein
MVEHGVSGGTIVGNLVGAAVVNSAWVSVSSAPLLVGWWCPIQPF